MKNLILIIFVLFVGQSIAQNPAEKSVIYIPVHHQPGSEKMPLEYNTQTTRIVQVMDAPNAGNIVSVQADSVKTSKLNSMDDSMLKAAMNADSTSVIITYKLESSVQAVIKIQDFKGNIIHSFETRNQQDQISVLTRDWVSGIYSANLYLKGKAMESYGFTVPELKKSN
jgi:hypothetical protein